MGCHILLFYLKELNLNILVDEIYKIIGHKEKFDFRIITPLPSITGVRTLYIQLFSNLISNAIKYNDKTKGLIEINYKILKDSHEISIGDNGPGIPNKYRKKVFEAFQTLNQGESFENTGIGLSIVQKIISLLNGSIRIESFKTGGANFIIKIPKD